MTFIQWLESRNIDCLELTAELEAALQSQWKAQFPVPTLERLIVPSDCLWPARGYWTPPVSR
ncbi:hypothetical protein [Aureliella helgolandensis]|uniref:Uncharacterized protein n=1 Tax=Aureliella helgolandensis TaxID=2527968 RepID=A0A518G361_9BACT|nr:hypothetical protein [Aureliella helgolandensis]QDV23036.1 hypothetical protein Q31a_13290 [Aureliella helgolandensis]